MRRLRVHSCSTEPIDQAILISWSCHLPNSSCNRMMFAPFAAALRTCCSALACARWEGRQRCRFYPYAQRGLLLWRSHHIGLNIPAACLLRRGNFHHSGCHVRVRPPRSVSLAPMFRLTNDTLPPKVECKQLTALLPLSDPSKICMEATAQELCAAAKLPSAWCSSSQSMVLF